MIKWVIIIVILALIGLAINYKNEILGLIGLAIIIFLGVKFFKVFLAHWKITLAVVGVLVVMYILYIVSQKKKYRLQLEWLDRRGIEQVPNEKGDEDFWKSMEDIGLVKGISSGHVLSNEFYSSVSKKIEQQGIFAQSVLQQLCRQSANQFQNGYLTTLATYLEENSKLFKLQLRLRDAVYLSPNVISECEDLFNKEGAATRNEFAQVCSKVANLYGYPEENRTLSDFIIDRLLSREEINEVELQDRNDFLYVAKKQKYDSKMTKREINLDD